MHCAQCHALLAWPKDFPNSLYAICWSCMTEEHEARNDWFFIVLGALLCAAFVVCCALLAWTRG